jgi:hypothetical protein
MFDEELFEELVAAYRLWQAHSELRDRTDESEPDGTELQRD